MNIKQQATIILLYASFLAQPISLCAQANKETAPAKASQCVPCTTEQCGKVIATLCFLNQYSKSGVANNQLVAHNLYYLKPEIDKVCGCQKTQETLAVAIEYAQAQTVKFLLSSGEISNTPNSILDTATNHTFYSLRWAEVKDNLENELAQLHKKELAKQKKAAQEKSDREKELANAKSEADRERHEEHKKEFERAAINRGSIS